MKLSRGNASDINRVAIGCAPCSRVTPIPRVFGYGIFGASNFVTSRADGTIRGEIRETEEEILSSFFFFFFVTSKAYNPSNCWQYSIVER